MKFLDPLSRSACAPLTDFHKFCSIALMFTLMLIGPAQTPVIAADQFYLSATCLSEVASNDGCNITFHRKSLAVRFYDGRSMRLPYESILKWNYTDSTQTKMDLGLASRIGVLGLLFKKVIHKHVFSISYLDGFGDKQSLVLNFSDTQFALPMRSLLEEYAPGKQV